MGTTFSTFAFTWLNQAVNLTWFEAIPSAIKRMKIKIFELIKEDERYAEECEKATTYSLRNELLIKYMANHEDEIIQKLKYTPYQLLQVNAYHTYRCDVDIDDHITNDAFSTEAEEESGNYSTMLDVMANASVDCLKKLTTKQRQLVLLRLGLIKEPLEEGKWFGEKPVGKKQKKATKKNAKKEVAQP
jgi:DNA-directed RNA polymerase sigma subunit (sigma70/sigma32)